MIVRCPECSTGFKLPDDKVADKGDSGVKLRCSKCSHVFRIRSAGDGEVEIFYNDSDRDRNAEQSEQSEPDDLDDQDSAEQAGEDDWDASPKTQIGGPAAATGSAGGEAEVDPSEGNKTQLGMPAAKASSADGQKSSSSKAKKLSKSASSDYNPFPHANVDLKPKNDSSLGKQQDDEPDETTADEPAGDEPVSTEQAEVAAAAGDELDWGTEKTRVDDDPFGDAFDDDEQADDDPFGDAFDEDEQAASAPAPAGSNAPAAQAPPPGATKPAPASAQAPAQQAAPAQKAAASPGAPKQAQPAPAADPAAAAQAAAAGAEAGASPFDPGSNTYRPEDMVDPSFGQDGPAFDPDQGVVDQQPPPGATTKKAAGPAAAHNHAAPNQPGGPAAQRRAAANQTSSANRADRTSQPAQPDWDVDAVDEPIAPHTIGGSGFQKFANFLLILLVVGIGFLAVVAARAGGFVDLQRFPHMLEVAFEGADFKPRPEWAQTAAPASAPAPEDPLRFNSVFATPVALDKDASVLLLRGKLENVSDTAYDDVVVRGILYDANERVIAQTTAPLGARVGQSQIAAKDNPDQLGELLPKSAKRLAGQTTEPFSLIFDEVPPKVFDNADVLYRVEIADKKAEGGADATGAQ